MKSRRKFLKAALLVLAALFSAEAGLRLAGEAYRAYVWRVGPGRDARPLDAAEDAFRVVCVGESTVVGVGATDRRRGYPAQLERLLNEMSPRRPVRVFALGGLGFHAPEIAVRFEGALRRYRPHLVLLNVGENTAENWFDLPKEGRVPLARRLLFALQESRALRLAELARFALSGKHWARRFYDRRQSKWTEGAREVNRECYRHFLEASRRAGAAVALCNYFMSWYNEDLRRLAQENGVPLCDVEAAFRARGSPPGLLSEDGWHPNDAGYRLMAETILETLRKDGLAERLKAG
jgi:lysophospholipase L1-like esterase